eukprot:s5598_g6.t1
MLEEHFKAIEAPVVARLALSRSGWAPDVPFSLLNRAYSKGVAAAAEVLYWHNRPLLRVPADYEKFFVLSNCHRLMLSNKHADCRMPFVACIGAVSSPELSRAAQDPMLRLREKDGAAYTTSGGRRVAAAGYVDDIEHYGNGLRDLPAVLNTLALGSSATGVGFAWTKFSAFATDWESALPHVQDARLHEHGATVSSWNIWAGGVQQYTLPRSHAPDIAALLRKRGTALDRHSIASQDTEEKLAAVRLRVSCKCCSWDEALSMVQLILGGILGYAPLIGLPSPSTLHLEDAALHRLILSSLGTRVTAEHVSLSAPRSVGGLGLPLLTDLMVASAASDLLILLNGTAPTSLVARDTLRQALMSTPADLPQHAGTITNSMRFLAGYGFYVSLSTDRFVARLLDNLNPPAPHPLLGPFSPSKFEAAARFCRVGVLANSVRQACQEMMHLHPRAAWDSAELWAHHLPRHAPVSPVACARAAWQALAQSDLDWRAECSLFHIVQPPDAPEQWGQSAWEDPWDWSCDLRSQALLHAVPDPPISAEHAIYGDGGFSARVGASFACQARGFGRLGEYWDSSAWVSQQIAGKLPRRLGWENTTIHTAELRSLLCALRFRRPGHWHLLVFDRSALFASMRVAAAGSLSRLLNSPCLQLVVQLKHVLGELRKSWRGAPPPAWRMHQQSFPNLWNVKLPLNGKFKEFSQVAYAEGGVAMKHKAWGAQSRLIVQLRQMYVFLVEARSHGNALSKASFRD